MELPPPKYAIKVIFPSFAVAIFIMHRLFASCFKIIDKSKILDKKAVKRVLAERDAMINLEPHPFVVQLFGALQDDSRLFFVMELVKGGDLFNMMSYIKGIELHHNSGGGEIRSCRNPTQTLTLTPTQTLTLTRILRWSSQRPGHATVSCRDFVGIGVRP